MRFYKIALLKSYFDCGYAITSYLKYIIAFFGLASRDVYTTLIIAVVYGVSCFILGWAAYKYGFVKAQIEVSNNYNEFVKEMRNNLVTTKKKKFK